MVYNYQLNYLSYNLCTSQRVRNVSHDSLTGGMIFKLPCQIFPVHQNDIMPVPDLNFQQPFMAEAASLI